MAERRMFTQKIVDSDAFLDMPLSTQALYFHLNMRADDDGFVNNPKKVQRMVGASEDDLKVLVAKRFILTFENGVIVIKHWRMHNLLRKDRYSPTQYQEQLQTLSLKDNGSYTDNAEENLLATSWQPDGNQMATQYSIGKDSIVEDSKGKVKKEPEVYFPDDLLNQAFLDFIAMRKKTKSPMTDRAIQMATRKLNELSNGDNDLAIKILEQSIMNNWKDLYPLKQNNRKVGEIDWASV